MNDSIGNRHITVYGAVIFKRHRMYTGAVDLSCLKIMFVQLDEMERLPAELRILRNYLEGEHTPSLFRMVENL
jgi:hypothetical protein